MSTKPPPLQDDENTDWESEGGRTLADPTLVAIGEPVTAPHNLAPVAAGLELELAKARDAGYEAGFRDATERRAKAVYEEGQADIRSAMRSELLFRGLDNEMTAHLVEAVWRKRTRL